MSSKNISCIWKTLSLVLTMQCPSTSILRTFFIFMVIAVLITPKPVNALSLSGIVSGVSSAAKSVVSTVSKVVGSVVSTAAKVVGSVVSAVTNVVSPSAASSVTSATNSVISSVNKATGSTTSPISTTTSSSSSTGKTSSSDSSSGGSSGVSGSSGGSTGGSSGGSSGTTKSDQCNTALDCPACAKSGGVSFTPRCINDGSRNVCFCGESGAYYTSPCDAQTPCPSGTKCINGICEKLIGASTGNPNILTKEMIEYVINQEAQRGQALWFDMNIRNIYIDCPQCPNFDDGQKHIIPGFRFELVVEFETDGNQASEDVILKGTIKYLDKTVNIDYTKTPLSANPGTSYKSVIIPEKIPVNDKTIASGSDNTFDLVVDFQLINDRMFTSPSISYSSKRVRTCSWQGLSYSCQIDTISSLTECCNELCQECGEKPSCLDLSKCTSELIDNVTDNHITKIFKIEKLTPYLAAKSGLGIV